MKLRHFIFPVMALMGLMSPASGSASNYNEARIAATTMSNHFAAMQQLILGAVTNRPDPPPWLRPNQRQRRLARRRAHAAGVRHAFA
jgi:hypothetical protein